MVLRDDLKIKWIKPPIFWVVFLLLKRYLRMERLENRKKRNSMIYKLFSLDAFALTKKPETGMGYQVILASRFRENDLKRYVVYNSELAITDDFEFKSDKGKIIREGFRSVLTSSKELILDGNSIKLLNEDELRSIDGIKTDFRLIENRSQDKRRKLGGKGAIDNPREPANGIEIFVRLSAYAEDKRIDFENKKLKPGSYTTTQQDYKDCLETSDQPIDRYALPNDEAISWAFYIKPKSADILQRGIVQPAFDHLGGGVEVYFADGTSKDTYLEKKPYGQ